MKPLNLMVAVLAFGCAGGELPDPEETRTLPASPAAPAPAPVELELELDTVTPVVAMGVRGAKGEAVEGVLAGADGRRALRYSFADGATETIAEAGWLLPPAAAAGPGATRAVCWNQLPAGKTARLDRGLTLRCRVDEGDGWGPEIQPAPGVRAPWLQEVVALGKGRFRVVYHPSAGGLLGAPDADAPEAILLERGGTWRAEN